MSFSGFVQIDSLEDLTRFEEKILGDYECPLSGSFIDWICDEESGEEITRKSEEFQFEPGVYFIWYEKTYDRTGPVSIQVFQRIPDNIQNMKDMVGSLSALMFRQSQIGKKMEVLRKAFDSKDEETIKVASDNLSKEELDEYKEINNKLDEMGYSHF